MTRTYKESGVNIKLGASFIQKIQKITHETAQPGADGLLGGFNGIFDPKKFGLKDPLFVAATDGVGTKLLLAILLNKHDTIGIDLVAMCANDVLVQGARPLIFLDYFACGKLDLTIGTNIIKGIKNGCLQAGCTLLGGETAEMPSMYTKDKYDLAGFCVGAVERNHLMTKEQVQESSTLIGLESSGPHANGFSLIRAIIKKNNIALESKAPFCQKTWAEVLLEPTKIYVSPILKLLNDSSIRHYIHGLCHITGGGFCENLPRSFSNHLQAVVYKKYLHSSLFFSYLQNIGNIEDREMYNTFNCGIGMVMFVQKGKESIIKQNLSFFNPVELGFIRKRKQGTDSVIFI